MLLDCATIPMVMILSFFVLKTRYKIYHYIGAILSIGGLIVLVFSDTQDSPEAKSIWFGDLLVIAASALYAISNVAQEKIIKEYSQAEYLGMIGLFGSLANFTQLMILERSELFQIKWSVPIVFLLLGFALCLFSFYSLVPLMLRLSSATFLNISLLSSDILAIVAAIFLFDRVPSVLYFIAYVIVMLGVIIYNINPQALENPEVYAPLEETNEKFLEEVVTPPSITTTENEISSNDYTITKQQVVDTTNF